MAIPDLTTEIIDAMTEVLPPKRWLDFSTLVAVSGGADSVALIRLLHTIRERSQRSDSRLIVAHFNHGLRPDSDLDEQFVGELAAEYGLDFFAHAADISSDCSEESLRDLRYQWLLQLAAETGSRYLVTGHTFDDQVETILFRFLRGTGISGLSGIPTIRVCDGCVSIFRPLLKIQRSQIEAYLRGIGQNYRTDDTNMDSKFTRNFLRHQLLPMARERFGDSTDDSIVRLGNQASEVDAYLSKQADYLFAAVTDLPGEGVAIDCRQTMGQPQLLVRQFIRQLWIRQNWALQPMTHAWFQTVSEILVENRQNCVLNLPGSVRLEKREDQVKLAVIGSERQPR